MKGDGGFDTWPNGRRLAVSLTYDGALPEHLEVAVPLLNAYNFLATFFVGTEHLLEVPGEWQHLALMGHEIGAHPLYGVTQDGWLPNWTDRMVEDDLELTHKLLLDLFPMHNIRSGALPGGQMLSSHGPYVQHFEARYPFLRSALPGVNDLTVDRQAVLSIPLADLSLDPLNALEHSMVGSEPVWFVFSVDCLYTGISDELLLGHELLLKFLGRRADDIWVAPFGEIATCHMLMQGVSP